MPARTRSQDAKRKIDQPDDEKDDVLVSEKTKKTSKMRKTAGTNAKASEASKKFFSPRKRGTKEQEDASKPPSTTTTATFVTPQKKASSISAKIVTPGLDAEADDVVHRKDDDKDVKREEIKQDPSEPKYVPTYLYKNVEYSSTSDIDKLSAGEKKAYHLITKHFNIPSDLEQSRKYGPYSGSCFEERVLAAYQMKQLKVLVENDDNESAGCPFLVCVSCGDEGHMRRSCPKLL